MHYLYHAMCFRAPHAHQRTHPISNEYFSSVEKAVEFLCSKVDGAFFKVGSCMVLRRCRLEEISLEGFAAMLNNKQRYNVVCEWNLLTREFTHGRWEAHKFSNRALQLDLPRTFSRTR